MTEYTFAVTGGIDVPDDAVPLRTNPGSEIVTAFELPDGRIVRACFCLEVESADGTEFEYVVSDEDMRALGFTNLDYALTDFDLPFLPAQ